MKTSKPNQVNQGFGINIIVLRNLILVFMRISILTDKQIKYKHHMTVIPLRNMGTHRAYPKL